MSGAAAADPAPWWRRFGRRNLVYLAFCAVLVPLGLALEAAGPKGPDAGGGLMFGFILWGLGSAGFMLSNLVVLVAGLAKGRPVGKALIGLALPPVLVILVLASEPLLAGG